MSRYILIVAFALLCVSSALAAPADEEKKTDEVAAVSDKKTTDAAAASDKKTTDAATASDKKGTDAAAASDKKATDVASTSDKKTPADDRNAVVSDSSYLDTLLSGGNTWRALSTALASLLVLGGLGLALYYFYYLKDNNGVSKPQELLSGYEYAPGTGGVPGVFPTIPTAQPYGYYPAGRALPGGSLSFARVLDLIAMAQETYEKFDFQSLDCQKKALCDLTQKQTDFGETGRKISSTFSFIDVLNGFPMPKIIQTYLKEYKEAIIQGKNSSKDCAAVYPKCDFSIKEVFVKYSKKSSTEVEES